MKYKVGELGWFITIHHSTENVSKASKCLIKIKSTMWISYPLSSAGSGPYMDFLMSRDITS